MAQLTAEQHQMVESWAEAGATLNDIQNRLKSEFSIALTYLEARMLMLETGVRLKDKARQEAAVAATAEVPPEEKEKEPIADDLAAAGPAGGGVIVSADPVPVPGAIASGKATFSDGKTATWFVDEVGRLGVKAAEPGYQPPTQDIPLFEQQLDALLQSL